MSHSVCISLHYTVQYWCVLWTTLLSFIFRVSQLLLTLHCPLFVFHFPLLLSLLLSHFLSPCRTEAFFILVTFHRHFHFPLFLSLFWKGVWFPFKNDLGFSWKFLSCSLVYFQFWSFELPQLRFIACVVSILEVNSIMKMTSTKLELHVGIFVTCVVILAGTFCVGDTDMVDGIANSLLNS